MPERRVVWILYTPYSGGGPARVYFEKARAEEDLWLLNQQRCETTWEVIGAPLFEETYDIQEPGACPEPC